MCEIMEKFLLNFSVFFCNLFSNLLILLCLGCSNKNKQNRIKIDKILSNNGMKSEYRRID